MAGRGPTWVRLGGNDLAGVCLLFLVLGRTEASLVRARDVGEMDFFTPS